MLHHRGGQPLALPRLVHGQHRSLPQRHRLAQLLQAQLRAQPHISSAKVAQYRCTQLRSVSSSSFSSAVALGGRLQRRFQRRHGGLHVVAPPVHHAQALQAAHVQPHRAHLQNNNENLL